MARNVRNYNPNYATPEDMAAWADEMIASREPDFIIGDKADPYMLRWWVVPRNRLQNLYLHKIMKSDDDRALHDHPWDNTSVVLRGTYVEVTPEGRYERWEGDVITRKATDAHRLVIPDDRPAITLFFSGPIQREWGFHCPDGWRVHTDFHERGCD